MLSLYGIVKPIRYIRHDALEVIIVDEDISKLVSDATAIVSREPVATARVILCFPNDTAFVTLRTCPIISAIQLKPFPLDGLIFTHT